MAVLIEVASWACLVGGGLFCIVGAVGLLRMPDFYTRMHAASVTDTLGAGFILGGLLLQAGVTPLIPLGILFVSLTLAGMPVVFMLSFVGILGAAGILGLVFFPFGSGDPLFPFRTTQTSMGLSTGGELIVIFEFLVVAEVMNATGLSQRLIRVAAERALRTAPALDPPEGLWDQFLARFPYAETDDQLTTIDDVLDDMAAGRPMDRLVCGDVGFGKTEVAMRAAFVAAQSGHQVAVLVPTTLLAQQHYDSFRDRFADWPVHIEQMSRFRSAKQQAEARARIADGRADIVIGTHKLLQDAIGYHNLGLVIIDEEHRFGVRQKDQLKALRAEVDVLTLTATPIPRTLNMSMAGMRDLSIIATPPARRLAIKTFVRRHDKAIIKEAVLRELLRGGQVYFVHNDVSTIQRAARDHGEKAPDSTTELMRAADFLSLRLDLLRQAENLDTIRGIEGDAAVAYFAAFNRLIGFERVWEFDKTHEH